MIYMLKADKQNKEIRKPKKKKKTKRFNHQKTRLSFDSFTICLKLIYFLSTISLDRMSVFTA
jgi:hypothetical protein